ncbi:DUF6087 family protein [Streptomyces sp. P6-2-1]|uniref:DUF6087 family protein n=1 Tax=Streptomyces sp. P6-2-1 TaxID=3422591 RepID=UPI003D36BAAF
MASSRRRSSPGTAQCRTAPPPLGSASRTSGCRRPGCGDSPSGARSGRRGVTPERDRRSGPCGTDSGGRVRRRRRLPSGPRGGTRGWGCSGWWCRTRRGGACAAGEPRAVRRWNGYAWEPYAVTRDLVEALRPVRPEGQPQGSAERCPGSWPESPEPAPPRSARCDSGNGRSREDRPSPRVVSGAGSRRGDRGRVARSGRGSA